MAPVGVIEAPWVQLNYGLNSTKHIIDLSAGGGTILIGRRNAESFIQGGSAARTVANSRNEGRPVIAFPDDRNPYGPKRIACSGIHSHVAIRACRHRVSRSPQIAAVRSMPRVRDRAGKVASAVATDLPHIYA